MTCHACGTALSTNARFCHKCGAAVGTAPSAGWRTGVPWAAAGAALGALVAVLAMRGSGSGGGSGSPPPAPGSQLVAPDISQMSPEERATRLFNRIMTYAEAGKTDSVRFFLPMAIGAYSQLPVRDADAHYHLGLMQLAGGDVAAALAEADSIQRLAPSHLFAYVLRAHAFQQQGNRQRERQAYADFLKNEKAELARNRPEYEDHRDALTAFKAEAERQMRGGA